MNSSARRPVLIAAAALIFVGCSDGLNETERDAAGSYLLTLVNGLELPFELGWPCGEVADAGFLELGRENRYFIEVTVFNPDCPEEAARDPDRWTGSGLWTVIDQDIRLVSDPVIQHVTFGAAPAPLVLDELTATARFEVLGYEGESQRPDPAEVAFTFVRF